MTKHTSSHTTEPIQPDREDFETIVRQYGKLPAYPSKDQIADRYRLAQATKLIRLYAKAEER